MTSKIRDLKTLLVLLRSNLFNKDKESALYNIEKILYLLDEIKEEQVYSFLFVCVSEIEKLVQDEKLNQAYDLVDCIHVIPDIVESSNRDWKSYWEIYVEKYVLDWGASSLRQFKEEIINLH